MLKWVSHLITNMTKVAKKAFGHGNETSSETSQREHDSHLTRTTVQRLHGLKVFALCNVAISCWIIKGFFLIRPQF